MIGSREDAKKKVNEAKSLRLKEIHQKAYSKIQKEMKVLRTDKRANRDELATKGEEAAKWGESGRNRPSPNLPVKDKRGK